MKYDTHNISSFCCINNLLFFSFLWLYYIIADKKSLLALFPEIYKMLHKEIYMNNRHPDFLRIYYCGREQCSPGHSWGPAIRPHYLLHVVLQGCGSFRYNQQVWTLHAGNAFLIEPMKSHFYQADHSNPWEYAWVGFDGSAVEEILKNTALHHSPVFLSEHTECCQPMAALTDAFLQPEHNTLDLSARLLTVFAKMPAQQSRTLSYEEEYYQAALDYIKNNYTYDLKIQDIADYVGIDRTYLYKIFIKQSGISPKQYLQQYRIHASIELLQSQQYSITETAYSCGFRDVTSFCTTFRQQLRMTPGKYKEKLGRGVYL